MPSNVELMFPQVDVDADIKAYDKAGKEIQLPHSLVISPYYFRPDSVANVLYAAVSATPDGEEQADSGGTIQRVILQLPGSSGKLKVVDRSSRVVPKFAKPKFAKPLVGEASEHPAKVEVAETETAFEEEEAG